MFGLIRTWALVIGLGWAAWPLAATVFPHARTRGYVYARPLALILLAWSYWLLNVFGVLDNSLVALRGVTIVWALVGLVGWLAMGRPLMSVLQRAWRQILVHEAVALVVLVLVAVYKAHMPGILHTEQPMDFAFLNGCWVSRRLPPQDPWLAGHTISYYYLGYLFYAILGRLAGLTPGVAYNVGLIITAGLTAQMLHALLSDLAVQKDGHGHWSGPLAIIGALGVVLSGNGQWAIEVLHSRGWLPDGMRAWLGIPGLDAAPVTGSLMPEGRWWWWRASRVIDDANMLGRMPEVITEFPAFSLVLGDLHPHVMSLPFLTLGLAMGVALYRSACDTFAWRSWRTLTIPLALGALGMLNSWDLPTMLVFCWLCYAAGCLRRRGFSRSWAGNLLAVGCWLLIGSVLPYLPFYRHLQSQASGIGLAYYTKTRLSAYLICTSPWIWIVLANGVAMMARYLRERVERRARAATFLLAWCVVAAAPWLMTLFLGGLGRLLLGLGVALASGPWTLLAMSVLLAVYAVRLHRQIVGADTRPAEILASLTILCGLGLTYLCEFFFVQDMFGSRTNTMFKVYYQAWMFLGVGSLWTLAGWALGAGRGRLGAALGLALIVASLAYPGMAAYSKSEGFVEVTWGLDGTAHLRETRPDEAAAIDWILENTAPDDVILLAEGEEFVPWTSRVAAWTGRPTVLGWPGHEAQWRGDDDVVVERRADIETVYTTRDLAERDVILRRYDVRHVVVGPNEIEAYDLSLGDIAALTDGLAPVYTSATLNVYAVPE